MLRRCPRRSGARRRKPSTTHSRASSSWNKPDERVAGDDNTQSEGPMTSRQNRKPQAYLWPPRTRSPCRSTPALRLHHLAVRPSRRDPFAVGEASDLCRQVISSRIPSWSTARKSSRTSRDFPIPGTPTNVTSCGFPLVAHAGVERRPGGGPSRRSRPTSGRRSPSSTSTPSPRSPCFDGLVHSGIGSPLPFASKRTAAGPRSKSDALGGAPVRGVVDEDRRSRPQRPSGVGLAVLTTSPEAMPSPASGRALRE